MGKWEEDLGGQQAVEAALEAAGLKNRTAGHNYQPAHFDGTFHELNVWLPVLEVVRERLEDCGPLDGGDEGDAEERAAA